MAETTVLGMPEGIEQQSFVEAAQQTGCMDDENDEVREDVVKVDKRSQFKKSMIVVTLVVTIWLWGVCFMVWIAQDFEQPDCSAIDSANTRSCKPCGSGTNVFPLFGEYERTWPWWLRAGLYFFGILNIFQGMGLICDQFMAGIEEITSHEFTLWKEVRDGAKHKFHIKVWNDTVANLTLMALGSSAPEILLSTTELVGNGFYSGTLGASTIVGSAAFNLFMISAVCVVAIPAPMTKKIEGTGVFLVTATISLWAYIWVLIVLVGPSKDKVDLWEALVTLAFFPVLVLMAFGMDRGWLGGIASHNKEKETEAEAALLQRSKSMSLFYGKELPLDTVKLMVQHEMNASRPVLARSQTRKEAWGNFMGFKRRSSSVIGTVFSFGFVEEVHTVLECAGEVVLTVASSGPLDKLYHFLYFTREGTASESRFKNTRGYLHVGPGDVKETITVPIIDNDMYEPTQEFYVELIELTESGPKTMTFSTRVATVQVLNDDVPGTICFDVDEVQTDRGLTLALGVRRKDGTCGDITVDYETKDMNAIAGRDYEKAAGTLEFAHKEEFKLIKIEICDTKDSGEIESFKVLLSSKSEGVLFDKDTDGGEEGAACSVIINSKAQAGKMKLCLGRCINADRWKVGFGLWKDQFKDAIYVGGSPEEQASADLLDWALHTGALIWKLLFTTVPPPVLLGGWGCFFVALVYIAMVTAFVGDLAKLLGCVLTIPDEVTAITLVALGTSVPDMFTSRLCAQRDSNADNAVGNITGSNSANVFLGLGLSWTVGAIYWGDAKKADDTFWSRKMGDSTYRELYYADNPDGGFFVMGGSLGFSVGVYTACAVACLSLLFFRRVRCGGELGGPKTAQIRDALLLVGLWVAFLTAVIVYSVM